MSKLCSTKAEAAQLAAELEAKLKKAGPFLGGPTPGPEDAKMFEKMLGSDNVEVARWAKHISSFPAKERAEWVSKGPTKAERKAAFAAGEGQNVKIIKKEKTTEKAHEDCLESMDDHPSFPKREETVLEWWNKIDAFHTSLKQSKEENRPVFTFYDGPPFATGLPHYGHILAGTIKDIVCRWAHQTGHHVERRFGWDCHGLPIEFEIEKELGIKTSHDVMKIGIKKYNEHCRGIVMRYAAEWEKTVTRMGRWIDFKNDYKTMNLSYMESVWWVFSQLYEKGLVYRGYKVMPYSIGCTTVLSNFEANMNYKNVSDPSVVVTLPLISEPDVAFLAWTTTPWTLPSNLALCVNPTMVYYQIKVKETGKKFILAKDRLVQIFPKITKQKGKDLPYELIKEYKGAELKDIEYTPLFQYYINKKEQGAFRVLVDAYVTSDSGTGVVHQAPAFGEDDYRVCLAHGIISKDEDVPCPVDGNGQFTDTVPEWKGKMVKDADKDIQKHLKDVGRLFSAGAIKHDYPFCWRSESPLIYKTIASWFVNVTDVKEKLLANNKKTYWVPENVQTGRFNNWLEQARDWAVSRNRYWGTPLPLWVSEDYTQVKCIGSVAELEQLTGQKITDIHRDSIDELTIPDPRGAEYPPLRRVPEVFDCWFESGSMPYAQQHYPFENKEKFENGFPADFIAEGIDQTRGWFYTLLVLSSAIFDKPPFKNLIVNGLVLAEDGQKMSKRKRNYPPPTDVIDKYGADALRLYLINSPVVRGMDLKFKEADVKAVVRDVLLPMYSALNFFTINYNRLVISGEKFATESSQTNVMDCWISAECEKLITDVSAEMKAYHLYTVVPVVLKWVENLTNTYVRMNRPRMKGAKGLQDQKDSLATLFRILMVTAKVMAPFTPYMAEQIFQQLKPLAPKEEQVDSVHYLLVPKPAASFDEDVIRKIERLQKVCVMVRTVRDRKGVGVRKPVKQVVLVNSEQQYVDDIASLEEYVKEEVNTFELKLQTDASELVLTKAEPNSASLGKKFKKDASAIKKAIMADQANIASEVMKTGKVTVAGFELTEDDICLIREFKAGVTGYETIGDGKTLVLVNMEQDEETITVGAAREVVSKVQQLRKRAGLEMTDKVKVFYATTNETFQAVFEKKCDMVSELLRSPVLPVSERTEKDVLVAEQEVEDQDLTLTLCRA